MVRCLNIVLCCLSVFKHVVIKFDVQLPWQSRCESTTLCAVSASVRPVCKAPPYLNSLPTCFLII